MLTMFFLFYASSRKLALLRQPLACILKTFVSIRKPTVSQILSSVLMPDLIIVTVKNIHYFF